MEIKITTGTYNTSDYRVVKPYRSLKAAQNFVSSLGCKVDIYNGLQFSSAGKNYKVSINS